MSRFPAFRPLPASSLSFGEVLYEKKDGLARITINRPHTYVGQVGVRVGSVARGGATQRLPITTGDKQAPEMLLGDGKRRGFGDVHG